MYRRSPSNATRTYGHRSQVMAVTGHVGLLIREDLETELPASLLGALGQRLMNQGLSLTTHCLPPSSLDRGMDLAEWRSAWRLEGLLVYHQRLIPPETIQRMRTSRSPCVWCNHNASHDSVYYDEHSAAVDAVRELVTLGHRRIAFASFRDRSTFHDSHYAWRERLNGYRHAMVEAGLPPVTAVDGATSARELMTLEPPPTAVLTPSYDDALGIMHLACERGLKVPRDLSLVTFADRAMRFPGLDLSTLVAPTEFLGSSAVDLLLRQIELGEPVPSVGIGYDGPVGDTIVPPGERAA